MAATLRSGGWFVLDFLNAAQVRARVAARAGPLQPGERGSHQRKYLSPDQRYVIKEIHLADGRQFSERVRLFHPAELEAMRLRLVQLPEPRGHARLDGDDGRGALGVFLLVFLSTFPVVIPFIVMRSAVPALRASNLIAIAMLFAAGHVYGRRVGRHPWLLGISMVLLGALLSGLAMALGG